MTLDELERTTPNGLHDAILMGIGVDFAARNVALDVQLVVAYVDDDPPGMTPVYRLARLNFSEIQFVVIDPPDTSTAYEWPSMIDSGPGQPHTAPIELPKTDDGVFLCWIFVSRWNGFIRIAARNVALEWRADKLEK